MPIFTWEIIANTPWWIYAIACYLLWIGYVAMRPQFIAIKQFYLLPIYYLFLFIPMSFFYLGFNFENLTILFANFLLGIPLGWYQSRVRKIKALSQQPIIYVPGSCLNLCVMVLFIVSFFYSQLSSLKVTPLSLLMNTHYQLFFFALMGLNFGLMLGKLFFARACLISGPFLNESAAP